MDADPSPEEPVASGPQPGLMSRLGSLVGAEHQRPMLTLSRWLGFAGCLALYLLHALMIRTQFLGNACDDAFISFRYLRILVDHGELAYNVGERVEGYSNLLWLLLLVPLDLVGIEPLHASQILGLLLGASTMGLAFVILRTRLGVRSYWAQLSAPFLMACSGNFACWSVMGLESMLHAFLLFGAWLCYMKDLSAARSQGLSAIWLGALVLTRPEGLLVAGACFVLMAAVDIWRSRHPGHAPRWRFYAILLGIVGAYELFRVLYFGPYLWPNAVRAKVGHSSDQISRGIFYVYSNFWQHNLHLFLPLLAMGRWCFTQPTRAAGFTLFFGYISFFAFAGGDWSIGRFFAPLVGLGVVSFACLVDDLWRLLPPKSRTWPTVLSTVLTVGALGYYSYFGTSKHGEQTFTTAYGGVDARRVQLGRWIADHTPKDAKVGVYAAGQIAYYGDRYMHDMLGLNDAHIASIEPKTFGKGTAGHEKYDANYTLNTVRPELIVQPGLIPGLMQDPQFHLRYQPLPPFPEAWILRSTWAQILRQRYNQQRPAPTAQPKGAGVLEAST